MKNIRIISAVVLLVAIGLFSCKPNKVVTDITLDKDSLAFSIGQKVTLKATVIPDDAKDKTVVWSSSNNDVATVTADGVVEAMSVGTAYIFAKAGDKTATCNVAVYSLTGTNWIANVQYASYQMPVSLTFTQDTFTISILGMGEIISDAYIYEHPDVYFYERGELMVTGQVNGNGNKMVVPDPVGLGIDDVTFTKM